MALSVPVKNKDGEVIGVLARSVHLGDLQKRMSQLIQERDEEKNVQRVIALVEARDSTHWRLLDHPYLTEEVVHAAEARGADNRLFENLIIDTLTVKAIHEAQKQSQPSEVRLETYVDPVGRLSDPGAADYQGEWLAAMAPVSNVGWMVIVQERRDAALLPVKSVAERASRQTWLSLLSTAIALMAIIWSFVWRAYHRGSS